MVRLIKERATNKNVVTLGTLFVGWVAMFLHLVVCTPEKRYQVEAVEELIYVKLYLTQIMLSRFLDLLQPLLYQLIIVYIPIPGNEDGKFLVLRLCAEVKLRGPNFELSPRLHDFYCRRRVYLWRCTLKRCEIFPR